MNVVECRCPVVSEANLERPRAAYDASRSRKTDNPRRPAREARSRSSELPGREEHTHLSRSAGVGEPFCRDGPAGRCDGPGFSWFKRARRFRLRHRTVAESRSGRHAGADNQGDHSLRYRRRSHCSSEAMTAMSDIEVRSPIYAQLSVQRALLRHVPPALRGVAFRATNTGIDTISCYFDGP